ncbi:unnamed protein product [Sphacelaria rigidula]
MALPALLLALFTLIPTSSSFTGIPWSSGAAAFQPQRRCSNGPARGCAPATCVVNGGLRHQQTETAVFLKRRHGGKAWTGRPRRAEPLAMSYGGGATDRYSWQETDKELNVQARMPAWTKGKSVTLDLSKTHIKLALREENAPVIEGDLRGLVRLDGSYWTMESLDDGGKMLYLTLEKMPELTGLGPWMGVVQGEEQVSSDYPEERKAAEITAEMAAQSSTSEEGAEDSVSTKPKHTGEVDEDGFCQDVLAVQGMSGAMIARQVPVNGNALFSAVSASEDYFATGEHPSVEPKAIELKAKELRKKAVDFLADSYEKGKQISLEGNTMSARELVGAQAKARNMKDGEEYLVAMRDNTRWGGGPEVVALTHVLQRPIHVYELRSTGLRFGLERIGAFGTPQYQAKEPMHVLSTYARFPELDPGSQTSEGNHFLALFPAASVPSKNKR